jgi:hypothetical protein
LHIHFASGFAYKNPLRSQRIWFAVSKKMYYIQSPIYFNSLEQKWKVP